MSVAPVRAAVTDWSGVDAVGCEKKEDVTSANHVPVPLAAITAETAEADPSSYYWRQWLCFALLGVLNNFHYSLLLASAYSLASSFSALPLIGLIQWATVILAIVAKLANGLFLLSTRADYRVWLSCMACMMGLAVLSLSVSVRVGFWLALLAICIVGGYGAMCESVVLGYLKHFPPSMLGAWGFGTGGSGVTGTAMYLVLHGVLQLDNRIIYILIAPSCLIYLAAFNYIQVSANIDPTSDLVTPRPSRTPLPPYSHAAAALLVDEADPTSAAVAALSFDTDVITAGDETDGSGLVDRGAASSRWASVLSVGRHVSWLALQLALVYLFEFVILVGLASQADPQSDGSGWWYENAYEILSFCYQLGVLLSRTSISVVQIPKQRLPWLTLLQAINAVVWTVQAWRGLMPLAVQFVHMLFVGLLGGAMYVNVFHQLNHDARLQRGKDRELAINLVTAAYNVGLLGASIVETVLLNTLLTRQR